MALSKDVLGQALYDSEKQFNDKDSTAVGDIEAARLAFWKVQADEIIKHFKTAGVISVTVATTGTASAHTGTGSGTIS